MIEMGKKYKYRNGKPARVICVDRPSGNFPVISINEHGGITTHTCDGFSTGTHEKTMIDLIEVSEWEDFKIDEPVMVRLYDGSNWNRRYFAGVAQDGRPLAFQDGGTSWSTSKTTAWNFCRRPTEDELK